MIIQFNILYIYSQIGNQVTSLGRVSATSAIGYMVNQGEKFLNTYPMFAQNVSRGTSSPSKMVLYTYLSTIPVTIYSDDVVETVNITYYDSSLQQIGTGFSNVNIYNGIGQSDIALIVICLIRHIMLIYLQRMDRLLDIM